MKKRLARWCTVIEHKKLCIFSTSYEDTFVKEAIHNWRLLFFVNCIRHFSIYDISRTVRRPTTPTDFRLSRQPPPPIAPAHVNDCGVAGSAEVVFMEVFLNDSSSQSEAIQRRCKLEVSLPLKMCVWGSYSFDLTDWQSKFNE